MRAAGPVHRLPFVSLLEKQDKTKSPRLRELCETKRNEMVLCETVLCEMVLCETVLLRNGNTGRPPCVRGVRGLRESMRVMNKVLKIAHLNHISG